jgi:hypothetical protein
MKKIYCIGNSQLALKLISSGEYSNLHECDIFTSNFSYCFFRTNGRHLNMVIEPVLIDLFAKIPLCEPTFRNGSAFDYDKIEMVYSNWNQGAKGLKELYPAMKFMNEENYASSGISSVFHSMELGYDEIYLLGFSDFYFQLQEKIMIDVSLRYGYAVTGSTRTGLFLFKKRVLI